MSHNFTLILPILCLCFTSCASSPGVYEQTQVSLAATINDMYQAALQNDASKLYHALSKSTQEQYSESEFKDYFEQNKDYIIEYLARLKDEAMIQPYAIHAIQTGDPCGTLSMTLNKNNQWTIDKTPDDKASYDQEKRISQLLDAVKSKRFIDLINTYSIHHPEIAPERIREMLRSLIYLNESGITFSGPTAQIVLDKTNTVTMICTKEGWSIHHIN